MNKLKSNILFNTIYQLVALVFPLIIMHYVGGTLGVQAIGEYTYAFSLASVFAIFCMLGIKNYGIREIASSQSDVNKQKVAFWEIWLIQIVLTIVVVIVYTVLVLTGIIGTEDSTMALLQILIILSYGCDISWLYSGVENFKTLILRNLFVKVLTLIAILLLVKTRTDIYKYAIIMLLSYLLSNLLLIPKALVKLGVYKVNLRVAIKKHFKGIIILFIPVIAVTLYQLMDKVMLGAMVSKSQVGLYEYAEKIICIPISLTQALGVSVLPRMSSIYSSDEEKDGNQIIQRTLLYSLCVALASAVGLIIISDKLVLYLFGNEFRESSAIVQVLAIKVVVVAISDLIRTQYMIPKGYDRKYVEATLLGAVVNLTLNFLLIPRLFAIGAAIATIASEIVGFTVQYFAVRKEIPYGMYIIKSFIFLMLPVSALGAVAFFLSDKIANNLLTLMFVVICSAIIYFAIVLLALRIKKIKNPEKNKNEFS